MKIEFLNKVTLVENLPKIIKLYKSCFNNDLDETSFIWRYIKNPIDELLFVVAKEGEKIIASYSASPCLMISNGNTFKTAMSLNTMTHPNYRGKGLFVHLANTLYQYMSDNDYKMIWGFPNNISNRTFNRKLGWKTLYEVPTMKCDLKDKNIVDIDASVVNDPKFKLDYSDLQEKSLNDVFVKKYESYLRWRYSDNPDNRYFQAAIEDDGRVLAYIVYKEHNELINIVDINFIEIKHAEKLIKYVINFAINIKKSSVTIWAPINTDFHILIEKESFYNDYPVRYLGAKLLNVINEQKDVLSYYNWFINAGDNNEY